MSKIGVLGAGTWGMALSRMLYNSGHKVCVWSALKKEVEKIVKEMDESFTIHDFRMVCGEKRTNVLFDVAVPYGTTLTKDFIKKELERRVTEIDEKYCLIVTVEHTVL